MKYDSRAGGAVLLLSTNGTSMIFPWFHHALISGALSAPKRNQQLCLRKKYMSSTHLSLHYHIIFSTKERRELIADEWRNRLYAFTGGCIKTLGGVPEAVGGIRDPEPTKLQPTA